MTICDNCKHQAPNRNCRLALERGLGVFWGDSLKGCQYREARPARSDADDKQCVLCGQAGHRSHACKFGGRE